MQMFISTSIFTGKKWSSGYLFEQKNMGQNCIQNTPKQKLCQKKPESHQTTTRTAPPSNDLQTVVIPETPICEIARFIITNHQCQKNPKPTEIKSQQRPYNRHVSTSNHQTRPDKASSASHRGGKSTVPMLSATSCLHTSNKEVVAGCAKSFFNKKPCS